MKKKIICVLLGGCMFLPSLGVAQSVQNSSLLLEAGQLIAYANNSGLPKNFADFKQRCQSMLQTPEGAVKMYFDAVFCYINPQTRTEGQKMLGYVMHESDNWVRKSSFATFVSRLKDPQMQHIFRSFAAGTSPQNGYAMSPQNYNVTIARKAKESDYLRVNLVSSGADSERIVWVKQFGDGLWYVINNASTYAGVRMPAQ